MPIVQDERRVSHERGHGFRGRQSVERDRYACVVVETMEGAGVKGGSVISSDDHHVTSGSPPYDTLT